MGDELNAELKTTVQICDGISVLKKNIAKYLYILNITIHNERLPPQIFRFLGFSLTTPKLSSWKVSSLWDQPFQFFGQKCQKYSNCSLEKIFVAKCC